MKRIYFVDVARSYAIGLALFSHAMIAFGGWGVAGGWHFVTAHDSSFLRLITRSATPLFIFMFGMMLELVYARRAKQKGVRSVTPRLLKRAGQCYLGYALTALASYAGGYIAASGDLLQALFFLNNSRFSNILRFYTVALASGPILVWARNKFGLRSIVILLLSIWAIDGIVLEAYSGEHLGMLSPWFGILLGTGSYLQGPSVWHGFTFVLEGMIVANGLRGSGHSFTRFYKYVCAVALPSVVVVIYLSSKMGILDVGNGFIMMGVFRSHNSIGYYAVGTILCLATLVFLSLVVPRDKLPRWASIPLAFGGSSLFIYSAGNVVLNLLPAAGLAPEKMESVALAFLFIVAMLVWANWRRIFQLLKGRGQMRQAPINQ